MYTESLREVCMTHMMKQKRKLTSNKLNQLTLDKQAINVILTSDTF